MILETTLLEKELKIKTLPYETVAILNVNLYSEWCVIKMNITYLAVAFRLFFKSVLYNRKPIKRNFLNSWI